MRKREKRPVIHVTPQLVQTIFSWAECGTHDGYNTTDFDFKIRRLGDDFCIAYTPYCADSKGLTFLWDSLLYELPKGAYEGVLYVRGDPCLSVDMKVPKRCPVNTNAVTNKKEGCDGIC